MEGFLFVVILKILTEHAASASYGHALFPVKVLLNILNFTNFSAELVSSFSHIRIGIKTVTRWSVIGEH